MLKGKGLPRQAEVAQGVPGRLEALAHRPPYPRRNPWLSFSETDSTPGHMVPSGATEKKSPVTPPGIDPAISQLALRYPRPLRIYVSVIKYKIQLS